MDPHERVRALIDRALTTPARAETYAAGWSPATAEAYCDANVELKAWCRPPLRGQETAERWLSYLPCSTETLALYVAHLCQQGRAPATIRKAVSGIKAWHRLHGQPVPDGLPALAVLRDHETSLKAAGWAPKRAEAFRLAELVEVLRATDRSTSTGLRDSCLLMLLFGGMLSGEHVARLTVRDVAGGGPAGLSVRDPADGSAVVVPHWLVAGVHDPVVCPVESGLGWPGYLVGRGAELGSPLVRAIDPSHRVAGLDANWQGRLHAGGALSPRGLTGTVQAALGRGGVGDGERYNVQSVRIGGMEHRRLQGATVDELADEARISRRSAAALIDRVRAAEQAPAGTLVAVRLAEL